jgi:hypothetical protein
MEILIFDTTED